MALAKRAPKPPELRSVKHVQDNRDAAVRTFNIDSGIGEKPDFVEAEKIGALHRDRNRAAIGGAVGERVAVRAEADGGEVEAEAVVLAGILAVDEGIVGEVQEQREVAVAAPLRPGAVGFRAIGKSLLVIGTNDAPEMGGGGEGRRRRRDPRGENESRQGYFVHKKI